MDWGDTARESITLTVSNAHNGGAGPILHILRPMETIIDGHEALVVRPDGTVVHASRYVSRAGECFQGPVAGSQAAFAYAIGTASASPDGQVRAFIVDQNVEAHSTELMVLRTDQLAGQGLQDVARSASGLIALELTPALRVASLRDGSFHLTEAPGSAHDPLPIGNVLLFDFYDAPRRSVMKESPDLAVESYLAVPDADVMQLRRDGEWLAWMEGGERLDSATHWATRTLRAARFTPDGDALEPRTVTELGEGWLPQLGVGGGWVVAVDRSSLRRDVLAVHLETGEERRIPPPDGHAFRGDPVYVTATEVALRVAHLPSLSTRTVFKIPLVD